MVSKMQAKCRGWEDASTRVPCSSRIGPLGAAPMIKTAARIYGAVPWECRSQHRALQVRGGDGEVSSRPGTQENPALTARSHTAGHSRPETFCLRFSGLGPALPEAPAAAGSPTAAPACPARHVSPSLGRGRVWTPRQPLACALGQERSVSNVLS